MLRTINWTSEFRICKQNGEIVIANIEDDTHLACGRTEKIHENEMGNGHASSRAITHNKQ